MLPMPIKRREPPIGDVPQYNYALYPDPPSHDFITWLVIAEMVRRYHRAPGPLRVRFLLQDGYLGKYDYGAFSIVSQKAYQGLHTPQYSKHLVEHMLKPAMAMFEVFNEPDVHAPFSQEEFQHYVEYDYHVGHLIDAARMGHKVPFYRVPRWAEEEAAEFTGPVPPVIITLRECWFMPERNSNVDAWLRFAETIRHRHPVIFVRDTVARVDAPKTLGDWKICPRAAENAFVRAALYQRAYCNLFVCNGPVNWCSYSHAPYLVFKQLVDLKSEDGEWEGGQASGWRDQCHMEVGDQLPWANEHQRFTWTDDTFENICTAFEEFEAVAQRRAA